jgi:predicted RNA binding protein YcfA (HicA-like mRNA interferase family)
MLHNSREIIARVESEGGWILVRISGSHHIFKKQGTPGADHRAHPKKRLGPGLARKIAKAAGWMT